MLRAVALLGLLVAPLAAPGAEADWLQYGGDAARTGTTPDAGPAWPDVAYTVTLPWRGSTIDERPFDPIIIGSHVFVLLPGTTFAADDAIQAAGGQEPHPTELWRVDLRTGDADLLAQHDGTFQFIGSDGARIYATGNEAVLAWNATTGELAWGPMPLGSGAAVTGPAPNTLSNLVCGRPAVTPEALYVPCYAAEAAGAQPFTVHALGTADGAPLWAQPWQSATTMRRTPECDLDPVVQPCSLPDPVNPFASGAAYWNNLVDLSVIGDRVYAPHTYHQVPGGATYDTRFSSWTLFMIESATGAGTVLFEGSSSGVSNAETITLPVVTGNDDYVFSKDFRLMRYSAQGDPYAAARSVPFRGTQPSHDFGSGFALQGSRVYAATADTIHLYDMDLTAVPGFTPTTLPPGETWVGSPLLLTADTLIGTVGRTEGAAFGVLSGRIVYGIDAREGGVRWSRYYDQDVNIAVTGDLLVALRNDAVIEVLGTHPLGLTAQAETATRYPRLGDPVVVDLGSSAPGMHGSATEFRADWGDGTVDEWQTDPVFTHRYTEIADAPARFQIRNGAGQTSSIAMTFFIGQRDPTRTLLNAPFSEEHQETTFFILGILITLLFAAIGLYRSGRKRRRLTRELRSLEEDYTALETDGVRCEAMLRERRSRYRALFLAKKLEDAHTALLERRVDELRQGLRVGAIDEKLKFLPYGMVQHLRRLLADGHVDAWERSHFLDALEREPELNRSQRQTTRALIESWFAADAASKPRASAGPPGRQAPRADKNMYP